MFRKSYIPISLIGAVIMIVPIVFMLMQMQQLDAAQWQFLFQKKIPKLLINSFSLVATVTIGSLLLGGLLAWIIERTNVPFKKILRPLLAAPLIIPCYIITICYIGFFGRHGLCEKMLSVFVEDIRVNNIYGFWGAVFMLIIGSYPYTYTFIRSAIRRLDPAYSEAARALGAGRFKRLCKIMIPILAPSLTAGATLSSLYVLSDFGVVSLLRYRTFVNSIYEQMSGRFNYDAASALSLCLIVFTLIFLFLQERFGVNRQYTSSNPRMGQLQILSLKKGKWVAFAFCLIIVLIGFLIPVGVLLYWFVNSFFINDLVQWKMGFSEVMVSAGQSLFVSVLAASVCVFLALPLAYWVVRRKDKLSSFIVWVSQAGIALPGVLIALGISLLALKTVKPFNFSVTAIVLAFVIHFFAKCFQSIRSGYTQISSNLEESSRLLGSSPFRTFWHVTRPLLMSSIGVGWLLVLLSSLRELPAALLLRPAGFDTLTVKVWVAASEGFYEYAAFPALVLIFMSLPMVWLVVRDTKTQ